jgi:quercetin dioxygenase-like cupin family protein
MDTKRTPVISRRAALAGLGAGGLSLALATRGHGAAQEAIPDAGPLQGTELAPGVISEVFARAPSVWAPGHTVSVIRFTFQPGAELFPHSDPGTTVLGVASGTFGWTLLTGTAHVVRRSISGAAGPAEDVTVPGTEVILEPGDAIFYEDDVVHTARGAGADPAIVHAAQVLRTGVPRPARSGPSV